MVKIKTFIFNGKPNEVNKTLQENEEYTGVLNATFNVLTPVVRFRTRTPVTFNYVYIESLNRYYFVSEKQQDGDICTVRLRVDVLFTYKDIILNSSATLVKGGNANKFVSNRNNVYDVRPKTKKINFPNTGLLNETGTIVMVTLKGNGDDKQ
jgi:hypothetical protein